MRLYKHKENRGPGESQSPGRTQSPLLLTSGGHSIGASASVLPVNIQGWFPLGSTGLISLLSKELSRVFSSTTIWKYQFVVTQPSKPKISCTLLFHAFFVLFSALGILFSSSSIYFKILFGGKSRDGRGIVTFSPTNSSKDHLNAEQLPQNNFWTLTKDTGHPER